MSIRVMQWVWDHSQSKNGARLVLLAIADNAADDGGHAYPSNDELARKANLSERAVRDAKAELIKLGELEVILWGAPGGSRSNMHRVIMTTRQNLPPRQDLPDPPAGSAPLSPAGSAGETVLEPPSNPSVPTERAQDPEEKAPEINAGSIVADWIDYCGGRGIRLTKQAIGRYAKKIRELLDEGFQPKLIKHALSLQLERKKAAFPGMLDAFIVEVQGGRPADAHRPAPAYQSAAEKSETRRTEEAEVARIADELAAQYGTDPKDPVANLKISKEARQIYESRSTTCHPTGYSEPDQDVVDAEWTEHPTDTPREVTAA